MSLRKATAEVFMHKQGRLALNGEAALEALWKRFPERSRNELVSLYARLMARVARADLPSASKENKNDTIKP
jgi:hypothetical protein